MASLIAIERWERRARRHGWWVLLLVAVLCLLPGTGDLPLIDRDEPRFTRATVEMMETQQWIIPFFNEINWICVLVFMLSPLDLRMVW